MKNKFILSISLKSIIISAILLLIIFIPIFLKFKYGYVIEEKTQYKLIDSALKPLDLIYLPLLFFPNKLEKYQLVYNQNDFEQLEKDLPTKVGLDELTRHFAQRDYIKGTFIYSGKSYPVEIAIKGEGLANYINTKKSLRVKFTNIPFKGRQVWSFVVPEQRRFNSVGVSEYLAKKLNIPIQQWNYAWLRINDDEMGVYEMIDETDTSFAELNQLSPNNLIFREDKRLGVATSVPTISVFSEYGTWKLENKPEDSDPAPYTSIENLKTISTQQGDEFRNNIKKILDIDEFLKWSTILYLLNDQHQDDFNNVRLVFLKEKGQFWFIPDHIFVQPITQYVDKIHRHSINEKILTDPQNYWERNRIIYNLFSEPNFETDLMKYLNSKIFLISAPIYQDNKKAFRYLSFKKMVNSQNETIKENISTIKSYQQIYNIVAITTNLSENKNSELIASTKVLTSSFLQPKLSRVTLKFEEIPKESQLSLYFDINENEKIDENDLLIKNFNTDTTSRSQIVELDTPLIATRFDKSVYDVPKPVATSAILFKSNDSSIRLSDLNIAFANSVTSEKLEVTNEFVNGMYYKTLKLPEFIKKTGPSTYHIAKENYTLNEDIEIPEGELTIAPGTKFQIAPKISIISRSNIISQGTKEDPIVFTKSTSANWGSLIILNAKKKSIFSYTHIEYGSGNNKYGIVTTGALASHYSDIVLENSRISFSSDDDGLNVKHAVAEIKNNVFDRNFSDHIDFDSVNGLVENNEFINIEDSSENSDGLDISFSQVEIKNNRFFNSKDKCISIGENSVAQVYANIIDSCNYGIAVKDGARAEITNNIIKNNNIAIGTYLKKVIYETGGTAKVSNNKLEGNFEDFKTDANSKIE